MPRPARCGRLSRISTGLISESLAQLEHHAIAEGRADEIICKLKLKRRELPQVTLASAFITLLR